MACDDTIIKRDLPDVKEDCTFPGLTWTITSSDDSEYAATLSLAEFIIKDSTGAVAATLTSATSGQVTINTATAYLWSVTVEPRILTLDAGFYTFTLYTTDADSVRLPQWEGSLRIHA